MDQYDLIVIGGGAGGLTVASGAASLGAKVALIEKAAFWAGTAFTLAVSRPRLSSNRQEKWRPYVPAGIMDLKPKVLSI